MDWVSLPQGESYDKLPKAGIQADQASGIADINASYTALLYLKWEGCDKAMTVLNIWNLLATRKYKKCCPICVQKKGFHAVDQNHVGNCTVKICYKNAIIFLQKETISFTHKGIYKEWGLKS